MSRVSPLRRKLSEVAEKILDQCLADEKAPLDTLIDALKAVGAYDLGVRRIAAKSPDDSDDDRPTFKDFRERLNIHKERPDA